MVTADILLLLDSVKDPEIPVLSIVDLGVITNINITAFDSVTVEMTPTFTGCPALDTMKEDIKKVLMQNGYANVTIEVTFREPWHSDKISAKGRKALAAFGLAPPPFSNLIPDLDILESAICPRCNQGNTEVRSYFGSTLCRSIHYCHVCQESFEQFKPL